MLSAGGMVKRTKSHLPKSAVQKFARASLTGLF